MVPLGIHRYVEESDKGCSCVARRELIRRQITLNADARLYPTAGTCIPMYRVLFTQSRKHLWDTDGRWTRYQLVLWDAKARDQAMSGLIDGASSIKHLTDHGLVRLAQRMRTRRAALRLIVRDVARQAMASASTSSPVAQGNYTPEMGSLLPPADWAGVAQVRLSPNDAETTMQLKILWIKYPCVFPKLIAR